MKTVPRIRQEKEEAGWGDFLKAFLSEPEIAAWATLG